MRSKSIIRPALSVVAALLLAMMGGGVAASAEVPPGMVWGWGENGYGQLGDGSTIDRSSPVQVSGLSGVTAVSTGYTHSVALKSDGTVWALGYNGSGQLGDGSWFARSSPVQVRDLSGVTAISSGAFHNLALKSDGTVWAWGSNFYGQLGDGSLISRNSPVRVSNLSGVAAISTGWYHNLALKSDGTLLAWGYNEYGQLGDGTTHNRTAPVQVSGLGSGGGVVAAAGGWAHSLALKSDGTVRAWGYNGYAQLGDGSWTSRSSPVQVIGLSGVAAIAGGGYHSLALKSDGTVRAWGKNSYGHLGDGSTIERSSPVQVIGLSGVTAIGAGTHHSLALKSDGTVHAWGHNGNSELGDGTTASRLTPVQVRDLSGVTAIGTRAYHNLALSGTGDTTPPAIAGSTNPAPTSFGWNSSPVTVTWSVRDPESGISSSSGCGTTTLTAETAGTTLTCSATNGAGLSGSSSVTVKIDKMAPTLSGSATTSPNAAGWYRGDVRIHWSYGDDLSGIDPATAPADSTITGEGTALSATASVKDRAGNQTTATSPGVNIDRTPPSVTITGVANGATYTLGNVPTPGYTATDGLSGVSTQSASLAKPTTASGAGSYSYTASATDRAGNTTTVTATYQVVYGFAGFLQPIPAPIQSFKVGSAIPVKFKLTDAGGASVSNAVATLTANGAAATPQGNANSGSQFRYDPTEQTYVYNLSTKGMPVGSLKLVASLDDGTTRTVEVTLK